MSDCGFLSALMVAVDRMDPAALVEFKKRITAIPPIGGGPRRFLVTMTDKDGATKRVPVTEPSVPQRLIDGRAGDGSLWVGLFEQAYASQRQKEIGADYFNRMGLVNKFYYTVGAVGEDMKVSINRVTGKKTAVAYPILPLTTPEALLKKIRDLAAMKQVMTICTPDKYIDPVKQKRADELHVHANHAYAVYGYSDTTKKVHLRNPHNSNAPGGKDIFLSIDDVKALFVELAYE
ncbi:MAG: hypothetical protein K2W96_17565 [Gemmataceae bacterium]|nr:hypothetical protein [Gemmataceae bacterium]